MSNLNYDIVGPAYMQEIVKSSISKAILRVDLYTSKGSLVGFVVSKSHACYLLEGAGQDWGQISVAVPVAYLALLSL